LQSQYEKDFISVITPVWKPNFSQLKESLDSVINQTYKKLEIIVIYQKAEGYDEKFFQLMNDYTDKQIKVLTCPKGISIARNQGIKHSRGEFIAHMDSDDVSEKDRFERQLKFKKENNYDVVGSWGYNISNEGKIIARIQYPTKHVEIRKKIIFHNLILSSSVLMNRKMVDDVGLFDTQFSVCEDYDLWLRAMSKGYKFGNVPEFLIRIRENPTSVTRGSAWREQRKISMKVRNRAIFRYGFCTPRDIFYHTLTPLSYFISPKLILKIKKMLGWYQN